MGVHGSAAPRSYDPRIARSVPKPLRAVAAAAVAVALLAAACTIDDRKVQLNEAELLSGTYTIDPVGSVTLANGSATVDLEGTDVRVEVVPPIVRGDFDGDRLDDAALVVDLLGEMGNMGTWLLLVRNGFGTAEPTPAVPLGENVLLEEISAEDGQLRLQMLDRSDAASIDTVDRRSVRTYAVVDGQTVVTGEEITYFADMPPAGEELEPQHIQLSGATPRTSSASGHLEPDQQVRYDVSVSAGERLDLGLQAPLGTFLTVFAGDDEIIGPSGAVAAQVASPTPRDLTVRVRNVALQPVDFRLDVEVSRKPPDPPPVEHKVAYLTFDDGPHPTYTPQVLDVLRKHGAKATFFVLGSQAQAHPELIDRIAAEGHAIANHTWDHPDLVSKSDQQFADQVIRTQTLLGSRATSCLRPPYGSVDETVRKRAEDAGMRIVLWTADTNDWRLPGASTIARRIVAGLHDGANILMHDGGGDRSQTVAGLEQALAELEGSGWRFKPAC